MINYVEALGHALERSRRNASKLPHEALTDVGGFSGVKFKHLLNNLGAVCQCYLEIGSLHGASLTATCYKNDIPAYAIENFSEFDGDRDVLQGNAARYAPKAKLILRDAWDEATIAAVPQNAVDLYFYDGNHSEESQERALKTYDSRLTSQLIFIVDDWNWPHVKAATERGVAKSPFDVLALHEISCPEGDGAGYWNGLGIYVLRRK